MSSFSNNFSSQNKMNNNKKKIAKTNRNKNINIIKCNNKYNNKKY